MSISQQSDAVEQLVKQAYRSADSWTLDELSQDCFTAPLASNDHRQWVHQSRPTSYQVAVAIAQHTEAYFRAEKECGIHSLCTMADLERVVGPSSRRVAGQPLVGAFGANGRNDSGSSGDCMQILEKHEQLMSQVQCQRPTPQQSQEWRCYGCGSPGHYQCDCPRETHPQPEVLYQDRHPVPQHRQSKMTRGWLDRSGVSWESEFRPVGVNQCCCCNTWSVQVMPTGYGYLACVEMSVLACWLIPVHPCPLSQIILGSLCRICLNEVQWIIMYCVQMEMTY